MIQCKCIDTCVRCFYTIICDIHARKQFIDGMYTVLCAVCHSNSDHFITWIICIDGCRCEWDISVCYFNITVCIRTYCGCNFVVTGCIQIDLVSCYQSIQTVITLRFSGCGQYNTGSTVRIFCCDVNLCSFRIYRICFHLLCNFLRIVKILSRVLLCIKVINICYQPVIYFAVLHYMAFALCVHVSACVIECYGTVLDHPLTVLVACQTVVAEVYFTVF